jgi:hypothetical protein
VPEHSCLLHPNGRFRVGWDRFIAALVLWVAFVVPVTLAFEDEMGSPGWLETAGFGLSPKRCSHSDVPLYILLVIIRTKYTGERQNDSNV